MNNQLIMPHLWYDKEALEAVGLYCGLFEDSRIIRTTIIENTPSGDAELVSFELAGQEFLAINGGPYFQFNPSISLMVLCHSKEEVNKIWEALSKNGTELMPLGEYTFSKWYSWVQDRYGLSWQLMLTEEGHNGQKIIPCLLFSDVSCGKAEDAMNYYIKVFQDSEMKSLVPYEEGEAVSAKARIKYAEFVLSGMKFVAMDHGYGADFNFNEAFSLIVNCQDQNEIDYYWEKLSAVPEAEQCGWLKDQFGLSWQIVPEQMREWLAKGTKAEIQRITKAFLQMKKFDLEALEKARLGIE